MSYVSGPSLGIGEAEARALSAGEQQDGHLALRDGRERQPLVFALLLKRKGREIEDGMND